LFYKSRGTQNVAFVNVTAGGAGIKAPCFVLRVTHTLPSG